MRVTLLALNLLAAAASASMAEDFVNSMNANATSSDAESTLMDEKHERRKTKTVLRGAANFRSINDRELKNHHKDRKDDKDDKDGGDGIQFVGNSHGLNYFVPSYPGKSQKNDFNGKFDPGYTVRPRPSNYGSSDDNKYTRPITHGNKKPSFSKKYDESEVVSYTKADKKEPEEDYLSGLTYADKEKAEEVNETSMEGTEWAPTPEPSLHASPEPTISTLNPSLLPTWAPSLEPTPSRNHRVSADTAEPTFDETADPTLQPIASPTFDETAGHTLHSTLLTGAPTFDEQTASPTFDESTGSPTFDETAQPTAAAKEKSSTSSTVQVITTTGWETETNNVTWSNERPERTRPPTTPEPTESVSTAAPTVGDSTLEPTISPSISTADPTMTPSISIDAPVSSVGTNSPTSSTKSPSYFPTYLPTSTTTSPTFYDGSTTTTTEATFRGYGCIADFCECQLSDDYLMEYKLNVPDGESVDVCDTCSLTVRLTYEGEAWLGIAFSTDGQMIGSEAVM